MKVVVDRFEEGFVVLLEDEGNGAYDIPREQFKTEVHEGDIFEVEFDENGNIASAVYLEEEVRARREHARMLMEKLRKKK